MRCFNALFAGTFVPAAFVIAKNAANVLPKLELRDVNFVHTSDIHSWWLGHRKADPESQSWNANIGDVVSFVELMNKAAKINGQDVFFVDTGDQTHGGGLSDSYKPAGWQTLDLQLTMPYDVMTPGNHELEDKEIAENLYNKIRKLEPERKERYLASNIEFYDDVVEADWVPLSNRYRTWTTASGRKVVALGVIFNNNHKTSRAGVRIQKIEDMVKEDWFKKHVLGSKPSLFLFAGHMSLTDKTNEWNVLVKAIRDHEAHKNTPIFIFGGHSHFRNCIKDFGAPGPVVGIESGRYLETVGWLGADLPKDDKDKMHFVRRYLDPSRKTFERHSGRSGNSFDSEFSKDLMSKFDKLEHDLGLKEFIGCVPTAFPWDHADYSTPNHVLRFYVDTAFPKVIVPEGEPYFLLLNNGIMRGPIGEGVFTKGDQLTNIPYPQQFSSIRIPRIVGEMVLRALDFQGGDDATGGVAATPSMGTLRSQLQHERRRIPPQGRNDLDIIGAEVGVLDRRQMADDAGVPGYVTEDTCDATPGDDVIHPSPGLSIRFPPKYVHSRSPNVASLQDTDLVNFITIKHLEGRVWHVIDGALQFYNRFCSEGRGEKWSFEKCKHWQIPKTAWTRYGDVDSRDVIRDYVKKHWPSPTGDEKC